ncbi:MAG: NACHT domain-containing protein [Candidatus Zixiibacteriota bacterium]
MFRDSKEFEDEVRRVARQLWPSAQFGGSEIVDGRERDGIFETVEFINIIECTMSRYMVKAETDGNKIAGLIRKLQAKHPAKHVRGWFITSDEPTADQRRAIDKLRSKITVTGFDQFRSKLVDARSYLELRRNFAFGSVRDPETGKSDFKLKYVPIDMLDREGTKYSPKDIGEMLSDGRVVVLTGDYGAGKSSTARQVFLDIAAQFGSNSNFKFPIMLNLRDHHGQTDPVEALERHARRIGFPNESTLVRAWRSGYCVLILDGFDEIASAGWAGKTKKLRQLRYMSMELIRKFLAESPSRTGIMLTGRAHFFDNASELTESMSIPRDAQMIELREFSAPQVQEFLKNLGWTSGIPEWLPTRPLLLAYLGSRGLLKKTFETAFSSGPAVGWHELLQRVCEREAEIEAGIDAGTVRRMIEHLATVARSSVEGVGPLTPDAITDAFKAICGYSPDDKGAVLLQRLPGLGASQAEDGSRLFIDRDFLEAAKGGAIFTYAQDPYAMHLNSENWQNSLRSLGAEVAAYRCTELGLSHGKILAAISEAHKSKSHTLCADLLLVLMARGENYDGPPLYLSSISLEELRVDSPELDLAPIEFQDSVIGILEIGFDVGAERLPNFLRCYLARVEGRTGERDMPVGKFPDTTFGEFENKAETTNAILALTLPLSTKVMLTILKKIYVQSGRGRRESALFRGLEPRAQQLVQPVLALLRKEELVVKTKQGDDIVWLPTRTGDARRRALRILSSPTLSQDSALVQSREIA